LVKPLSRQNRHTQKSLSLYNLYYLSTYCVFLIPFLFVVQFLSPVATINIYFKNHSNFQLQSNIKDPAEGSVLHACNHNERAKIRPRDERNGGFRFGVFWRWFFCSFEFESILKKSKSLSYEELYLYNLASSRFGWSYHWYLHFFAYYSS